MAPKNWTLHVLKTLGRDKSRILYQNSVRPTSQLELRVCLRAETQRLGGKDCRCANSQGVRYLKQEPVPEWLGLSF